MKKPKIDVSNFITFEGPDGSGKTTALDALKKYLDEKNVEYVFTREPGGSNSRAASEIRSVILDKKNELPDMTEALLYAADRRLNLERNIWPALAEGKIVLCDRYLDSSIAYQGYARGIGIQKIIELQDVVTEKTYPGLTILFDIEHSESSKRVDDRAEKDRLELAGDDFHMKVYDGYHKLIKMFPERIKVVNAGQSIEKVFEDVKEIINKKLGIK